MAFNKQKEIDPLHYEERVQKKILKQRSKGESVRQMTTARNTSELQAALKSDKTDPPITLIHKMLIK